MYLQKNNLAEGPIDQPTAEYLIENFLVSNLWVRTDTSFKAGYSCDSEFLVKFRDMACKKIFKSYQLAKEGSEWVIETTLNENIKDPDSHLSG